MYRGYDIEVHPEEDGPAYYGLCKELSLKAYGSSREITRNRLEVQIEDFIKANPERWKHKEAKLLHDFLSQMCWLGEAKPPPADMTAFEYQNRINKWAAEVYEEIYATSPYK